MKLNNKASKLLRGYINTMNKNEQLESMVANKSRILQSQTKNLKRRRRRVKNRLKTNTSHNFSTFDSDKIIDMISELRKSKEKRKVIYNPETHKGKLDSLIK